MSEAVFKKFREWGGIEQVLPQITSHFDPKMPGGREQVIAAMREEAELECFLSAIRMAREEAWEGYRRRVLQILMNDEEEAYFDHVYRAVRYYMKMDSRAEPILVVNPMALTMMQMAGSDFARSSTASGKLQMVGKLRGTPVWCDQFHSSGGASTLVLAKGWLIFKRNGGLIEREINNTFTIKNDIDFEVHGTKVTHYELL